MIREYKIINGNLYQIADKNLNLIFKELKFTTEPLSVLTLSKITRFHRSNIYDSLRILVFNKIVEESTSEKGTKLYKIKKQKEQE